MYVSGEITDLSERIDSVGRLSRIGEPAFLGAVEAAKRILL
jgi:hypothetical protein